MSKTIFHILSHYVVEFAKILPLWTISHFKAVSPVAWRVDRLTDWLVDLWTHHPPQTQIWTGHICSREAEMTVRLMKRARERNLVASVCNSYDTTWCDEIWNIVLDSEPAAACIVVIIIIIKINKHINRLQLYWLHGPFLLFAFMIISTTPASFDFRVWS